jgi:hypothetical protein
MEKYVNLVGATVALSLMASPAMAQQGPPDGKPYASVPKVPIKRCTNLGNMFEQPRGKGWGGRPEGNRSSRL